MTHGQERNGRTATKCRSCGQRNLAHLVSLGDIHLSGHFPSLGEAVESGVLALVGCLTENGCGLVQLGNDYDQEVLYGSNYGYRSGLNLSMVDHLKSKVGKIMDEWGPLSHELILDIGSNDGTTLSMYPRTFTNLVGVDPTSQKFAHHYPPHVKFVSDFFSRDLVSSANWAGKAKIISSFSMFYDLPSPVSFMRQIRRTLSSDGLWISEQSYLPSMLMAKSFDTICHEHLEYYSLSTVLRMSQKAGLKIIDCEFNDVNGGSFSFTAVKSSSTHEIRDTVRTALEAEKKFGLEESGTYFRFQAECDIQVQRLRSLLEKLSGQGAKVAGLGASTKGNVYLEYAKLDSRHITMLGDVNPDKWGRVTPGSQIPIESEDAVLNRKFDYYVVLPWHFRQFFIDKFKGTGINLIFPLPEVEVVSC